MKGIYVHVVLYYRRDFSFNKKGVGLREEGSEEVSDNTVCLPCLASRALGGCMRQGERERGRQGRRAYDSSVLVLGCSKGKAQNSRGVLLSLSFFPFLSFPFFSFHFLSFFVFSNIHIGFCFPPRLDLLID